VERDDGRGREVHIVQLAAGFTEYVAKQQGNGFEVGGKAVELGIEQRSEEVVLIRVLLT
jgi:hypothetical protein